MRDAAPDTLPVLTFFRAPLKGASRRSIVAQVKARRVAWRGAFGGLVAFCSGALAAPLEADAPPADPFVELSFDETPACLDLASVRSDVEERLERRVFLERGATYVLAVSRSEQFTGLQITLKNQLTGELVGSRELRSESQDCADHRALLPMVVTVLLEPYVREREGRASAPPAEESPEPMSEGPEKPAPPLIPPDFRCGLSAGIVAGFAPGPTAVARQACTLRLPPKYDLDLSLGYRLPGSSARTDPGFALQAISLRLAVCRANGSRLRIGACLAVALEGALASISTSGRDERYDFRALPELGLFGRFDYEFSNLGFFRCDAGIFVPLVRPVYVHQGALMGEALHQSSVVGGGLEIGAGVHWW